MAFNEKTDEELMVLYQNGNEEAFRVLYDRHAGKIFGFVKSRIKKEEQCRDIFQEVFTKLHKSKHLYNKTLPALPWIFTITKTAMIDNLRKEKTNLRTEVEFDKLAAPEAMELQTVEAVLPHLTNLPGPQKMALEMRYLHEKTFEEIAKQLNTSTVNVRQLISRGIKRVKELVGDSHENK